MYLYLRTLIVSKLFEVYINSKNTAYHHKKESYLIFKLNLEQFLADGGDFLMLIIRVYLKLSLRDFTRFRKTLTVNPAISGLATISQVHFERYERDNGRNIIGGSLADIRDDINVWVQDQISEVKSRRRVSGDDSVDKDILSLFRYLTIWGRIINPYSIKTMLRVDYEVQDRLEQNICKTFANLLDLPANVKTELESALDSEPNFEVTTKQAHPRG